MSDELIIAVVLGAILLIDAVLLIRGAFQWQQRKARLQAGVEEAELPQRTFRLTDVWFALQIAVVMLLFATFILLIVLGVLFPKFREASANGLRFAEPETVLYFILPFAILQNIVLFFVPVACIVFKYRLSLAQIGLPALPTRRDWVWGIGLGIVVIGVSLVIGSGLEAMAERYQHLPWVRTLLEYERNNPVAEIVQTLPKLGVSGLIFAVLSIGISPGFGEEMFFRGFLFPALKERCGVIGSIILSAVFFTLPHTYALGLLPVFLMGILLAVVYHRTGSLWIPILIHITNNTASVIATFLFPDAMGGSGTPSG
jgi:membrane protease YdiL (CAAX protease family)